MAASTAQERLEHEVDGGGEVAAAQPPGRGHGVQREPVGEGDRGVRRESAACGGRRVTPRHGECTGELGVQFGEDCLLDAGQAW